MKHFLKICLLFVVIYTLNVSCNNKDENKVTEQELELIYQQCPGAKILEVEYKANAYIEVEYTCNGQKFEAGISNNILIFNETELNETDIPLDKIRKKLKKEYKGWLIDEVSLVRARDTSFIKVEVVKDGLEQNLYFTQDGKWYNSKFILASNKWDVQSFSENTIFKNTAYNFLMPDSVYDMPALLREISGIEILSPTNILCVQDELGAVFEYDINQRIVSNSQRFTNIGDFEDIAIKGDSVYVLRSDGKIFNFNYKNNTKINHNMINVNSIDIESLFYNPSDDYFYIVSKDVMLNLKDSKRIVFRYKNDNIHKLENYLEIDIKKIKHYIDKHFPSIKSKDVVFNPSAIAVHPITKEIYILSASDRLLAVYDNKKLKAVYPLPAELYYKPEGIAFFENGDMLISNEGDKTGFFKGNISLLKYK